MAIDRPSRGASRFLAGLPAILHYHGQGYECSAFNLSQLAEGKGFLTDEFLEFLRDCGCKLKQRAQPEPVPVAVS